MKNVLAWCQPAVTVMIEVLDTNAARLLLLFVLAVAVLDLLADVLDFVNACLSLLRDVTCSRFWVVAVAIRQQHPDRDVLNLVVFVGVN